MATSKRTWSLPLPVQPCSDILRAVLVRDLDEIPGDDRARQCAHHRALVLVHAIGGQCLGQEVIDELLAHVDGQRLDGTDLQGLLLDELEVLTLLPDIARHCDDVEALFLHEPLDADGCVETTRVCKYDLVLFHFHFSFLSSRAEFTVFSSSWFTSF